MFCRSIQRMGNDVHDGTKNNSLLRLYILIRFIFVNIWVTLQVLKGLFSSYIFFGLRGFLTKKIYSCKMKQTSLHDASNV